MFGDDGVVTTANILESKSPPQHKHPFRIVYFKPPSFGWLMCEYTETPCFFNGEYRECLLLI